MPYVHIQVTREGVTVEQKEALIKGTTDLLLRVLNKNPAHTFVVIEEVDTDNWGVAGMSVTKYRAQERAAINKAEYPNLLTLVGAANTSVLWKRHTHVGRSVRIGFWNNNKVGSCSSN